MRLAELLRGLLPVLRADGRRREVQIELDAAPGLPGLAGDRGRLHEALELLLRHVVRHADPGRTVRITAEREGQGEVVIAVDHGAAAMLGPEVALARRVVEVHGGW